MALLGHRRFCTLVLDFFSSLIASGLVTRQAVHVPVSHIMCITIDKLWKILCLKVGPLILLLIIGSTDWKNQCKISVAIVQAGNKK